MASVNKVILLGFVGKDPEVRSMGNGKEVASFSLATTDTWKEKTTGEKKDKTEWHNCVIFGSLINVVKSYVKKGSKLYIEGALQTRKWEKDGVTRYSTEVVLQGYGGTLQMLDSKGSGHKSSPVENPTSKESLTVENEIEEEIPF